MFSLLILIIVVEIFWLALFAFARMHWSEIAFLQYVFTFWSTNITLMNNNLNIKKSKKQAPFGVCLFGGFS